MSAVGSSAPILTNDGVPLKTALAKTERRARLRAVMLVGPLALFLLAVFIVPIGIMLFRSVDNSTLYDGLPHTREVLANHQPGAIPDEKVLEVFAFESVALQATGQLGKISQRLNRFYPGLDSSIKKMSREVRNQGGKEFKLLFDLAKAVNSYVELANRLPQLNSLDGRLSHSRRVFSAQSSVLKKIAQFRKKAKPETAALAAELIAYAEKNLVITASTSLTQSAVAETLADLKEASKGLEEARATLQADLAEATAELERRKSKLQGADQAASVLAEGGDSTANTNEMSIIEVQSLNHAVSVAQVIAGDIRSEIKAYDDVLKAINTLDKSLPKLEQLNATLNQQDPKSIDALLKERSRIVQHFAAFAKHADSVDRSILRTIAQQSRGWLSLETVKTSSIQTLQEQTYQAIKDYPYLENSKKYDTWQALYAKVKKSTWEDPDAWALIQRMTSRFTGVYFLRSFDLKVDTDGSIVQEVEERQVYLKLFWRTLKISFYVALGCLLLGYPLAFFIAHLPTSKANLVMICVLLPFWTSLLVRTTAWLSILGENGVVNQVYVSLQRSIQSLPFVGTFEPDRLDLAYNQTTTLIAMIHILLPFMILPVFSVMKTISPAYMKAAQSLGATPFRAFWRVYFPQTLPGIGAGALLVFILAIGYFITPAIVGGDEGVLISNIINEAFRKFNNPQLAAALGSILLFGTIILYWVYNKIVGIDSIKLG